MKRQKTQFEETEQTSEPECDMGGILQLSDQNFFFLTMMSMLRTIMK